MIRILLMKNSHDRVTSRSPQTTTGRGSSSTAWISTLLRPLWTRTAGLMLLLLLPASAERISWGSLPGQEHVNSLGQPLNSGFQFELGSFAKGFLPSAQNTQEWAAHWIPIQRTRFNPRTRWFTSVVTVPATASPLQPGDPVYVWGFGGSESSGEWTLFRSDRWVWPKANPANPVPLQWFAKDATQVVLGSIRLTGGQLRLATAPVTGSLPPVTTWAQWRSEELGHGHRTAPAEDIDQDGQANIVDFVLGRDPAGAQAAAPTRWLQPSLRTRSGQEFLEVRVPRRRDRPVLWRIEVSEDCTTWRPASMDCEVVDEGPDAFVVRQTTPTSSPTCPRFLRVVPEPAP
ncbi:MAG: hypothetical protein RLZ45_2066 [Verrucomicrobiota bacterium]